MNNINGFYIIGGFSALVLFIGIFKKNVEWILNYVIRSIIGVICIYIINNIAVHYNQNIEIGINYISLLTSGILGIPGVIGLYILKIYGGL